MSAMGQKNRPRGREGRVVTSQTGERWTAQLELDERCDERVSRLRIDVPGEFASQATAGQAAQHVLNDWRAGRLTLRELVLRELAAAYRHLREKHKPMEPVAVPTTFAAWDRAITLWELAAWLDKAEAARYREHAERAFEAAATTVTRHRLLDVDPDSAP
jgi:hypothetical protein